MYPFHVSIHARPLCVQPGDDIHLRNCAWPTLRVKPAAAPLGVTFEQARDALVTLPRMVFEPDGSFVWRGNSDGLRAAAEDQSGVRGSWQLEGVLYDQGDQLAYVELSGACGQAVLEQLLAAIGWPQTPLMFQLLAEAVFLDEEAFFLWLVASSANVEP